MSNSQFSDKLGYNFEIQDCNLKGGGLPEKLRLIMGKTKTLNLIAKRNNLSRQFLSLVIKGERKSKRAEEILLKELQLTLAEIQEIIKEHYEALRTERYIFEDEIYEWYLRYQAKGAGKTIDEYKEERAIQSGLVGFPLSYSEKRDRREKYYYRYSARAKRSVA